MQTQFPSEQIRRSKKREINETWSTHTHISLPVQYFKAAMRLIRMESVKWPQMLLINFEKRKKKPRWVVSRFHTQLCCTCVLIRCNVKCLSSLLKINGELCSTYRVTATCFYIIRFWFTLIWFDIILRQTWRPDACVPSVIRARSETRWTRCCATVNRRLCLSFKYDVVKVYIRGRFQATSLSTWRNNNIQHNIKNRPQM